MTICETYWGSHGCSMERGHTGMCMCDCCSCVQHPFTRDDTLCVASYPYYGPATNFYGRDADTNRLRFAVAISGEEQPPMSEPDQTQEFDPFNVAPYELRATLVAIAKLDPSNTGTGTGDRVDRDYRQRNMLVVQALAQAMAAGYPCGVQVNPGMIDSEWLLAFIELPEVGQVSWHIPVYAGRYDGHTTEEKYARIRRWTQMPPTGGPNAVGVVVS